MDHKHPQQCAPVKLEHEDQVCGWSWPVKIEHKDQKDEHFKLECESAASWKDGQNYISRTDGAYSNTEEVKLPCAQCGLVFLQRDLFQRHMINCHGRETDSREAGDGLGLNVSDWLLEHVQSKQELFLIEKDGQTFDKDIDESLGQLDRWPDRNGSYQCDQCGHTSRRLSKLYKHILQHLAEIFLIEKDRQTFEKDIEISLDRLDRCPDGNRCYLCDQCGHTSSGLTELQIHILQHVVDTRTTRAEQNSNLKHGSPLHKKKSVLRSRLRRSILKDMREASTNGLRRSMLKSMRKASTRALKKDKDAAGNKHVLEFSLLSPSSPPTKNKQERHKNMQQQQENIQQKQGLHIKGNAHICDICSVAFSFRGNLLRHIRLHSRLAKYKCDLCGLSFCSAYNLQDHRETHKCNKTHPCRYCAATFSCIQNMKRHERSHTSQKPHLCEICGSGFSYPWHLTEHKRTHTGEKPYTCDFCQAKFALHGHLKKHRVIHTGERSYKCDECSRTFSRQTNLYSHKKIRHKIS